MKPFATLFDRFFPLPNDPTLTEQERVAKQADRRRQVFAFALILGAMLLVPICGALYVYLVEHGVIAKPG